VCVIDILKKPLSPVSAGMGEILESLVTSDAQGERLPNGDIGCYVDCCDAVFDREVYLEALSKDYTDHDAYA
jgi:hypothetical protein